MPMMITPNAVSLYSLRGFALNLGTTPSWVPEAMVDEAVEAGATVVTEPVVPESEPVVPEPEPVVPEPGPVVTEPGPVVTEPAPAPAPVATRGKAKA